MKISKRQLRRIINEECGAAAMVDPAPASVEELPQMMESENPEAELVMEMETALSGLQMVMESLDSAATICHDCVQEVAAQAPILQAVASQASALQETLEAVEQIVAENAAPGAAPVAELPVDAGLPQEIAAAVQLEVRKRLRRRGR